MDGVLLFGSILLMLLSKCGMPEDCLADLVLIYEVCGDDSSIIDSCGGRGKGDVGVRGKGLENDVFRAGLTAGSGSGGSSTSCIVVVAYLSRLCVDCENSEPYNAADADGDLALKDDSVISSTDLPLRESLLLLDKKSNGLFLPVLMVSLSSNWFKPNRDPVKDSWWDAGTILPLRTVTRRIGPKSS